jgi:hypothetical protein
MFLRFTLRHHGPKLNGFSSTLNLRPLRYLTRSVRIERRSGAIGAESRFRASGLMPSRPGMRYTSGLSLRPPACFRQNKEI